MADAAQLALIHAEIDGELNDRQRAELARCLLADPETRALRDQLRHVCGKLDAVGQVDPPGQLLTGVLAALPQTRPQPLRFQWPAGSWRYAAMLAGVIATGAIVFQVTDWQGGAASAEMAGTLAGPRAAQTVDSVDFNESVVSGQVSLTRDDSGLGLALELAARAPIDVVVASGKHMLRINGLGAERRIVSLPGFEGAGRQVDLTVMVGGREVARATLRETSGK